MNTSWSRCRSRTPAHSAAHQHELALAAGPHPAPGPPAPPGPGAPRTRGSADGRRGGTHPRRRSPASPGTPGCAPPAPPACRWPTRPPPRQTGTPRCGGPGRPAEVQRSAAQCSMQGWSRGPPAGSRRAAARLGCPKHALSAPTRRRLQHRPAKPWCARGTHLPPPSSRPPAHPAHPTSSCRLGSLTATTRPPASSPRCSPCAISPTCCRAPSRRSHSGGR